VQISLFFLFLNPEQISFERNRNSSKSLEMVCLAGHEFHGIRREKKRTQRERERERFDGLGWRGQGFANSYWTWVKDSIPSIGLDKT
jgi:hypothetical protein